MTRKSFDDSRRRTGYVLCSELEHTIERGKQYWTVTMSVAGRPSTFSRTWEHTTANIADSQLRDLSHWMAKQVTDAVILWSGAQQTL